MKLVTIITAIFDRILDLLAILAGVLIVFTMFSVGIDVLMRYLLNRPVLWAFDVTEISLLWITFLGTAWLLRRDGHVSMDILLVYLKPRASALIGFVTSILIAMICFILFWYGTQVTWEQFQLGILQSNVIENPTAIEFVVIPVGFLALFLQSLRRTYSYLKKWRGKEIIVHKEEDLLWNGG